MADITTRAANGKPLTHGQMDQNLVNLNDQGEALEARLDALSQEVARDKGFYATPEDLIAANPNGADGDYALVDSTGTVWMWDDGAWVDTDTKGEVSSVNGKVGEVALSAGDIPFTPVTPFTATDTQVAIEQARGLANARWLDDIPAVMDGAADGYLLKVTGSPGDQRVVAVPGVSAGIPVNAGRQYFERATEDINGVTYFQVGSKPPLPGSVAVTAVNTATGADVFNLVAQFVSQEQTEQLVLDSGLWAFRLWLEASHADCTLAVQVSILDVYSTDKTVVHNAFYAVPNTELKQFPFDFHLAEAVALQPYERIMLELICRSPEAGRTLTLYFDGIDCQSYVDVPIAPQHNELSQLQGGDQELGEFYHLNYRAFDVASAAGDAVSFQEVNAIGWWRWWYPSNRVEQGGVYDLGTIEPGSNFSGVISTPAYFPASDYMVQLTVATDDPGANAKVFASLKHHDMGRNFFGVAVSNSGAIACNVKINWTATYVP